MQAVFTPEVLEQIFPPERSHDFFEALYGDADDAAFDIQMGFAGANGEKVQFQFLLVQRPGKCLACNLTYGLPAVFSRHPVINIRKIVEEVADTLDLPASRLQWKLGQTEPRSHDLHAIPLTITIQPE
ncbi:hypothetical protein SAMN05660653_01469 [Desulfonatronum thiosulfatophilum]|uniref:Pancreas/duodenum homeobox protein 1 n=2 Tax=Desulfonatronum thiosulfatophilum TaxID=617002 RepID=A0A1G6CBQ2_9BACT|nr:hypothetical protein SAMN05660653_01469 [Desulfonatronum thiosulfatophilum]